MTSGWQGAPYLRRYGRGLLSKPAILLKKSRGGCRSKTQMGLLTWIKYAEALRAGSCRGPTYHIIPVCSGYAAQALRPNHVHLLKYVIISIRLIQGFFFFHTFTFLLLDKPWSQVSSLLLPGSCLQFLSRIGFSNPTDRRLFIECC